MFSTIFSYGSIPRAFDAPLRINATSYVIFRFADEIRYGASFVGFFGNQGLRPESQISYSIAVFTAVLEDRR